MKRFQQEDSTVEALRHVLLTVDPGKFVAIMGAIASGKSTLLHVVAGLTTPTEGTIAISIWPAARTAFNEPLTLVQRGRTAI